MQLYQRLLLSSRQGDPTANTTRLQDALKREINRIKFLGIERRRQHVQRRITEFLGPSGLSSSSSSCLFVIFIHV